MISFLVGILFAWIFNEGVKVDFIFIGFVGLMAFLGFLKANMNFRLVFFVVFCGLIFGVFRFLISIDANGNNISNFVGERVFKGCVNEEPAVFNDKVKYYVFVDYLVDEGINVPVSGKILINNFKYPIYEYGDCFIFKGKIQRPQRIDDFEYDKYLERFGIFSMSYYPEFVKLKEKKANIVFKNIYKLKNFLQHKIEDGYSEPYSSFLNGLLLGIRKGIPEGLSLKFNICGLSHIVAISGYNITLVICFIFGIFSFLEKKRKIILSILFVISFVLLVGMSSAVLRSGIMGIIFLLSQFFKRQYFVFLSIILSAFFMNLVNPKILIYDIGFQLSFFATIGIIYFPDILKKYFCLVPEKFGIRDTLLLTICAQILVLPIIINNFGTLSLVSPFSNVFVLPFIPLIMIFGAVGLGFSIVLPNIFNIFAIVNYVFLKIVLLLIDFFSKFKFINIELPKYGLLFGVFYYFFLFEVFKKFFIKKEV